MKKISKPAEQAATAAAPFQAFKHHFRDPETEPGATVADRETNEPETVPDPADVPSSSAALQGSGGGATDGVTGGDDPVRPDKVLDYSEIRFSGRVRKKEDYYSSYYQRLMEKQMYVSYNENFPLKREEKKAVYQTAWEMCPKQNNSPSITDKINRQFSIKVEGVDIYGTVQFSLASDKRMESEIEVLYVVDAGTPGRSGGIIGDPGQQTGSLGSMSDQIIAKDFNENKPIDPEKLEFDFTYPESVEKTTNRQFEFMKSNPKVKKGVSNYILKTYNELGAENTKDYYEIRKLSNKKDRTKDEEDRLNALNEKQRTPRLTKQILNVEGFNLYVQASFYNYDADVQLGYLKIAMLSSSNSVYEPKGKGKTAMDADIELSNQKTRGERLNIIGTDDIRDETEKYFVQDFTWYLFEKTKEYENLKNSSHFDYAFTIDGEKIAYSFTIEKSKQVDAGEGKMVDQRNIFVKRLGKIGEDIADPDSLSINDVYGYSDTFTEEQLVDFVIKRYSSIKKEDIQGATKAEIIKSVDDIINKGAETPEWYKDNYNIVICQDLQALKTLLETLGFYTGGKLEAGKELATVKGRTKENRGALTSDALTPAEAKVSPEERVQTIQDETENIKAWLPSEMRYIEMSMQKMSPALIDFYKAIGFKMFRQDYNLSKAYYNQVGGVTYNDYTIGVFDNAFQNNMIMGNEQDLSSSNVSTITHEMGHVLQRLKSDAARTAFNEFYKIVGVKGPTSYARETGISNPDSEFFPEAFTLFLHDPEFLHGNFPEIYMWFLYITEGKQTGTGTDLIVPTLAESKAFVKRRKDFIDKNGREPGMEETRKIVRP